MLRFNSSLTTRLVLGLAVYWVAASTGLMVAAEKSDRGIVGLAAAPVVRKEAADAPASKTWLYQCGLPFQVSSTQAALFVNVREALAQGVDFEVGNDVITFGGLDEIDAAVPVVVSRNHTEPNPNAGGAEATMVKYPIRGGLVPLGAKRRDGAPHPHAGTGFGLSMVQAWKILKAGPPPYQQNGYADAEAFGYLEFQQFAFDGRRFTVTHAERVPFNKLLEGWHISNGGMTNALPDGDDLLVMMTGKSQQRDRERFSGSGILQMRCDGGRWKPVAFEPIPQFASTVEPSLIRDVDGRLLASARGSGDRKHDVRVVRSDDGGRTWSDLVEVNGLVGAGPITLNQAADGTPYIAANRRYVTPGPQDPLTLLAATRKTTVEPATNNRNTLTIWPLSDDRRTLLEPRDVLDCRATFGPPEGSNWTWRADHPSGMTVRLADEKWHHLLGFRVQDYREIKEAMPPTPRTGMYVQEIQSAGPTHPTWNF